MYPNTPDMKRICGKNSAKKVNESLKKAQFEALRKMPKII